MIKFIKGIGMKRLRSSTIIILTWIFITVLAFNVIADDNSTFKNFITVKGDKIFDGDKQFRFVSFNIPNLLCIEDNMPFSQKNVWRLPDVFEIEDALKSIKHLGGSVARTYVITVSRADDTPDIPRYVLGPGKFNEEAFKVMDQVLASANEIGVRLIIPFVDNWKWMGGKPQYAKFRNKDKEEFWSDSTIKTDFKKTISFILNRVNTITGISYKNDKSILAWELGNELQSAAPEWIAEMAAYTKSIDKNHLINDGVQVSQIQDEVLDIPDIDILSTHHYENSPLDMLDHIKMSAQKAKGKKPYYAGEFGFISTSGIKTVLDYIPKQETVAGALVWRLRYHNRDGGFYWHSEPLGAGLYKAYHFPGFKSGSGYDEIDLLNIMRKKAFCIRNIKQPDLKAPDAPHLLPIKDAAHISWQGAVGAASYSVERAENVAGPWNVVGKNISDAAAAYAPLFNDRCAKLNTEYYYRAIAQNNAGRSLPSNIAGPVKKLHHTLVDEMENFGTLYSFKGQAKIQTNKTRDFKEDFHRLAGESGTEVIYYVPGKIKKSVIDIFAKEKVAAIEILTSNDGKNFEPVSAESENYFAGEADYHYWQPVQFKVDSFEGPYQFLKIKFKNSGQMARVEIQYGE